MALELFWHNVQAYNAVFSMLQNKGKAAVVHPTGTGKSFIAFKLCEDNPGKTVLWLSPSRYIFNTQLENLREALGAGSDPADTLAGSRGSDPADALAGSRGSDPDTDFARITDGITFCTYARLANLPDREVLEFRPDYIVLDEFHNRTVAGLVYIVYEWHTDIHVPTLLTVQ